MKLRLLSLLLVIQVVVFGQHTIKVVAHRGAMKFAPENTIAAFEKAHQMGADIVEMDIRQTKDGVLIIMHDKTVDRTTNGTGKVSDLTLKEIKQLDAGSWFGEDYKGTEVPTLEEALIAIKGKLIPDIDFKSGDVKPLVELLEKHGFLEEAQVTTWSSNWDHLKGLLLVTDKLLIRPSPKKVNHRIAALKEALNPPVVNLEGDETSKALIDEIHNSNMKAWVNCLKKYDNKKSMKKAIAAGADYIQADNLDILIPLVREHYQR